MQLKKLVVKKLYGYMNKNIEFRDDINLLVGINGSGKTSVLNLIYWLLTPCIDQLCLVEFKEISLSFELNRTEYNLVCTQTDTRLQVNLINSQKQFHPLTVWLQMPATKAAMNPDVKDLYKRLRPDDEEIELWKFLTNLPKPMILGLERASAFSEAGSAHQGTDAARRDNANSSVQDDSDPIAKVKSLTTKQYSKYRNDLINLNNSLKNSIMMSSFDIITDISELAHLRSGAITKRKILQLEKKVEKFFTSESTTLSPNFVRDNYSKVTDYFKWFKETVGKTVDSEDVDSSTLFVINYSQFKRINHLVTAFERFEVDSRKAFSRFKQYLDTVNSYFKDTSKRILFSDVQNELRFQVLGERKGRLREIQFLSSGEKQVLILLTFLAFHADDRRLFIVDEPELSLHPKWQDDFIKAAKQVMPANTQLLMATHSPAIVGRDADKCTVLFPYNEER